MCKNTSWDDVKKIESEFFSVLHTERKKGHENKRKCGKYRIISIIFRVF